MAPRSHPATCSENFMPVAITQQQPGKLYRKAAAACASCTIHVTDTDLPRPNEDQSPGRYSNTFSVFPGSEPDTSLASILMGYFVAGECMAAVSISNHLPEREKKKKKKRVSINPFTAGACAPFSSTDKEKINKQRTGGTHIIALSRQIALMEV
ncbi:hypothetical protein XELAEV_18027229mg [Xenopus laevis]|uniref:Uncharacterized protein n=1 Tax=Xenopus laevis TaxID=8355 RepID=A0A974HJR0_XENLA|nr:hypothetical protein XELAEV_18027229mg [Xenopus laevis]